MASFMADSCGILGFWVTAVLFDLLHEMRSPRDNNGLISSARTSHFCQFYGTQVPSLPFLVSQPDSLPLMLLRLHWCDPGVWGFMQLFQKSRNLSKNLATSSWFNSCWQFWQPCCWCQNKTEALLLNFSGWGGWDGWCFLYISDKNVSHQFS